MLVWVDDDDPQIEQYFGLQATIFVRPRVGYENFHKMVNFLAKESIGEWLLLWNDDFRLENDGLYKKIEQYDFRKPMVLNFWDATNPRNNLAPVISRVMFNAMGHFSLNTHCDSWVQDIANELGIQMPVYGVKTTHLREILNDETKQNSQAVYATSTFVYDSPEMHKLREKDMNKIREKL